MTKLCLTRNNKLIKFPNLPPSGSATDKQRAWDEPVIEMEYNLLLKLYLEAT
jgi:hypothetical protein